jgi:hypothetical protein
VRITARGLNRATLSRQLLLRRESFGVDEAVRRGRAAGAAPGLSVLALWNRLAGFDPTDLDRAFADYRVVKATLMRVTLHAVAAGDYRTFREAMEPTLRAARLDSRFRASGLTPADADALLPELLAFADRPRTAAEMVAWLEGRLGAPLHPGAWRGLRGYAPLLHAPTASPWAFGVRPAYVAAGTGRRSPTRMRPRRRCGVWSGATWRGSGPLRWRTWRSSRWFRGRGPRRRWGRSPASSSGSRVRTARSCSTFRALHGLPRTSRLCHD